MKKYKAVNLRFTSEEFEQIKHAKGQQTTSAFFKSLVKIDRGKSTDDAGQLVNMIRNIDAGQIAQKVNDLHDKFRLVDVTWFAETLKEIAAKVKNGAAQPDEKSENPEHKIDDLTLRDIFTFIRAELGPIARNASVLGSTLGEINGDTIMIARNLKAPENVKPATRWPEENSAQDIGQDPLKKIIRSELAGISSSVFNALSGAYNAWSRTSNTKMYLIENEVIIKATLPKKGGK